MRFPESFQKPQAKVMTKANVTCSEAESLVARLCESDVDLTLTQSKLQRTQIISKPGKHQQSCVVPRPEFELHCQPTPPKEPRHLEVVVGPCKGHGSPEEITACVVHFLLGCDEIKNIFESQKVLFSLSK